MVHQVVESEHKRTHSVTRDKGRDVVKMARKHPKSEQKVPGVWAMTHSEWALSPLVGINEEMEFKSRIHSELQ